MLFFNDRQYRHFNFFPLFLIIVISLTFIIAFLKKTRSPNIILISIDTLRADHLSCYGYKRQTTPYIDKLAKEGALFLQAIAPSTETFYSIPAIITSNYHHYFGLDEFRSTMLNLSVKTMAELLSDNGYNTALFSNAYPFGYIKGLDRGFKTFVISRDLPADKLTNSLLEWLGSNNKRKFFLWVHYFEPHPPYLPPQPYDALYVEDEFNASDKLIPLASRDNLWIGPGVIPYTVQKDNITSVNYYISQYDGEIRFIDEQIGLLSARLKELKLDKDTLVIITADHGENLGEHNSYFQHGGMPYDTLLHVPLIFKYEPLIPTDKKIEQQVSSIDIFPTILEMLKIKYSSKIKGKSLLNLLRNKTEEHYPYAFSKCASSIYSLRTKKWKLIFFANSKKYYLFDLENDKDELNNIKDIKKEEFYLLSQKLNEWTAENESMIYSPNTPYFDADTIEKLKSLGYLQGGEEKDFSGKEFTNLQSNKTIKISGKVFFDDYSIGQITVMAHSNRYYGSPDVAVTTIHKPDSYTLNVPANSGKIYLSAVIMDNRSGLHFPFGEYSKNPLYIGSEDIKNIDITLFKPKSSVMDTYNGSTVTISGRIICPDYNKDKEGVISIIVTSSKNSLFPEIALKIIRAPGEYQLDVPANIKDVYIKAVYNQERTKTLKSGSLYGEYKSNPIHLKSKDVRNIDIIISDTLKF